MHKLAKVALLFMFCAASGTATYFSYHKQQRLRCEAATEPAQAKVGACEVSCSHGDADHCLWLAKQIDKQDPARAASLYRRACDAAIVSGCVGIAHLMLEGRGVGKDVAEANRLLTTACGSGNAIACGSLGYSYAEGIGAAQDLKKAVALYQKACDGNDTLGCYNLAQLYNSDRLGNQQAKSAPLYKRACDASEMMACSMLGSLYTEGHGVDKDYSAAETLLSKACDHGEANVGCGELAMLYNHGWGVIRDLHRAKDLYRRSCDVGNPISCDHLANLLADDGEIEKALTLRKRACEQGELNSCGSLTLQRGLAATGRSPLCQG
jgi:TPR repeat protein